MTTKLHTGDIRRALLAAGLTGESEGGAKIQAFAPGGSGVRQRIVSWSALAQVYVHSTTSDQHCADLAASIAPLPATIVALCAELDRLRLELDKVKPTIANHLGEGGCARMRDDGVFLLNHHHTGWSSFGFRCDDWAEFFRRFNVLLGPPVEDKWGTYWPVLPTGKAAR